MRGTEAVDGGVDGGGVYPPEESDGVHEATDQLENCVCVLMLNSPEDTEPAWGQHT